MKLELKGGEQKHQRGKTLDELISGIAAKYKELLGIAWLNIHRLYDSRRWRWLRLRLFTWRKEGGIFRRRNLSRSKWRDWA
ncbi:MAG: hypothetical protein B7Z63_02150 [Ignavibacteriae bacterium 37-53-5]|nr:MAG: hypothetical protein B7Z63_02150 [Ignavibacteriae bacterium 37-53-5]